MPTAVAAAVAGATVSALGAGLIAASQPDPTAPRKPFPASPEQIRVARGLAESFERPREPVEARAPLGQNLTGRIKKLQTQVGPKRPPVSRPGTAVGLPARSRLLQPATATRGPLPVRSTAPVSAGQALERSMRS